MQAQKDAIKFAFAYTGVVVGAGFSTGQEVLQFFSSFGLWSFAGVAVAAICVLFMSRQTAKLGFRYDVVSHEVPLHKLFGKAAGTLIDYIFAFFMYGIAVIMIAGSGSAFEESFGIQPWIGSIVLLILAFFTLLLDFDKIVSVLGAVTPFLIISVLIISLVNIFNPEVAINQVNEIVDINRTPTGLWWFDAITYSGVVIGVAFSFLSIMGADADKQFIARRGAVYGAIIFLVMLLFLNTGMLAVLDEANHVALPTLVLANAIHPVFGTLFSIIIILLIYNTVVGLMYAFLARFTKPYSMKYKMLLVASLVIGYTLTFVGFVDLVNFFYPIFGYVGVLIGIALLVRWVMNKNTDKKLL
ncbi:hypothetical protein BN1048_00624 [Jeotgalicoccus saudimassiliensis]|uniref:Branched-chain amino acid transport system II carrier protein n=1 Tax=Jeotgalicoccus saudimassiliensis TaxID=1461582 RepID=A0A078LX25_9STAP|nr:membrane protein [Jeotgalicoccus saudimassiliensis]CDZ99728.1 hypothetical protein BN1048_00624 [Jeotgalicoccus saudimassiliensis]